MHTSAINLDLEIPTDLAPADRLVIERFSLHLSELRPALTAFLISRIGGDLDVAQDCLQEISLVLWKKHDPSWSREDFHRFAFRCATIEGRAYHRRNQRMGKRMVTLAPDVLESVGNEIISHEEADPTPSRQRLEALQLCLDSLPVPHREILEVRYSKNSNENSIASLAEARGWKVDALYKRLERLRTVLQDCILKHLVSSDP
ncbi:hypothetical protein OKA05_15090 [Luteolibacter arcticus]|uniref:Sigma-70 family RNA polymerase sigma factor n=1 Tax=Luteolibacter arcticus TaxID=1581411 RepID=A0ABT3GK40_9BACT|nr:hypothetical protein [Luteolibacter arcticus]MCW1923892.1 hypothetical protein [Luteolibacter arcticus]